jgi:hypothetical protein
MATPIIADYHQRFGDVASFAYVYIREAHASDEWPLGDVESHLQPTNEADRLALARRFRDEYVSKSHQVSSIPVYVDSMDNKFETAYSVWPERFFIIEDGKFAHIADPYTQFGFHRDHIENWLQNYVNEKERKLLKEKQLLLEPEQQTVTDQVSTALMISPNFQNNQET